MTTTIEIKHDGRSVWEQLHGAIQEMPPPPGAPLVRLERDLSESADRDLWMPGRTCPDAVAVWKGRSFGAYDPHGRDPAGMACSAEVSERLVRRYCNPNANFYPQAVRLRQLYVATFAALRGEAPKDFVDTVTAQLGRGVDWDFLHQCLEALEMCLGITRQEQTGRRLF